MKICILTERMRLGFGVDLVVDEQARRLAERGHEVVVLVIHAETVLPPRPYELIVLNRLMPIGDFGSRDWVAHVLSFCEVDADLWILSTPPFYDWSKFLDGPVVLVEYGAPPGHMFERHIGRHIDAMIANRFKDIYGDLLPCDAIVSISHSIHRSLPAQAQAFSTVVHLGCDHYGLAREDEARALRAELGVGPDDCLILWVGRMQIENDEQPYKGFKNLLSFLPLVESHVGTAKVVLAGRISDGDKNRLESGGVKVLPNLTPDGLARAFAAADVLVNLSVWEGFNLALLEAQFQGTPAIAFDLGPHPEIIRHGETGLLAKSPRELFDAVVHVANDRALRESLTEKTRDFAAQFSWEASIDKLEKVLLDCTAKAPPRDEIAAMRREAFATVGVARTATLEPEIEHARALLALDGNAFVRAARRLVFGFEPEATMEAMWLRRARRGASKRELLAEMADVAQRLGAYREVPGLRGQLRRARLSRAFASPTRGSEWLDIQDEVFVRHAYRTLLGREAAPSDIGPKVDQLRNGRSRASILVEMRFSDEGGGRHIEDPALIRLLDMEAPERPLSASDLPPTHEIAVEWSPWQEFVDKLLRLGASPESSVWGRYPDDEFVRRAYLVLLGRTAAPPEVDAKVEQLRAGRSRRSILAEIRFSDEGRVRRLQDRDLRRILLPEILKRQPPLPPRLPTPSAAARAREFFGALLGLFRKRPASRWFLLDDGEFARQAFRGLLGRDIDPATAAGLAAQLRDGRSRISILAEIRFSGEGKTRRLLDPELRRLLFAETLRRAPPFVWLLPAPRPGDHETEDSARQLRRIESHQRALAAEFGQIGAVLAGVQQQNAALGSVVAELDALKARFAALEVERATRSVPPPGEPAPSYAPFRLNLGALRLGQSHVALVAPETALEASALARLAEAAQTIGGDVLFGDECELLDRPPFERLRNLGPFSHDAFLRNPDLGGAIAVREELLTRLRLPIGAALTANVLLKAIAAAHKVTHLPATLSRRGSAAIAANRAGFDEMRLYVAGLDREAAIEQNEDDRFDIRFPLEGAWKAAIVVVADRADGLESALATLLSLTPVERRHLIVVQRTNAEPRRIDTAEEDRADLWLPADASYGRIVDEAARAAPADCNLVVLMEAGVVPTQPDWLERLAETALRSDAGVVAPKTLYADGGIRHAGLRFETDGACAYVLRFAPARGEDYGRGVDLDPLKGLRDVSAVSRHCMIFRREILRDQGGFSAETPDELCDVDFCFRLRRAGFAILLDGRVEMVQDDDREPRWARLFAPEELTEFRARHATLLTHEDRFWTPYQKVGGVSRANAAFLPPLGGR